MNLVWIQGPAAVLRAIRTIAGLMIDSETAHAFGEAWRVSAHATDEAILAIRNQGATVDVVMDAQQLDEHFERVRAQIQDVPSGEPATPAQAGHTPAKDHGD